MNSQKEEKLSFYTQKSFVIDNYAFTCIPKCGMTTLALLFIKTNESFKDFYLGKLDIDKLQYKHLNEVYGSMWPCIHAFCRTDNNKLKNKIRVAVFRDPIERLLSAKNIAKRISLEQLLQYTVSILKSKNVEEYNEHIAPQSLFYNPQDIDVFVELKNLDKYLSYIGYPFVKLNQRTNEDKEKINKEWEYLKDKYESILNDLYKEDYILLKNIPDYKLWKPEIYKDNLSKL